jgi:Tol biopolymer transport system component
MIRRKVRTLISPSWSSDGQTIAYTQCEGEVCTLWLMAKDGSAARQVPAAVEDAGRYLAWTPDGTHLLFNRESDPTTVWSVRTDGTGLRPIITGVPGLHILPTLQPRP